MISYENTIDIMATFGANTGFLKPLEFHVYLFLLVGEILDPPQKIVISE